MYLDTWELIQALAASELLDCLAYPCRVCLAACSVVKSSSAYTVAPRSGSVQ